MSENRKAARQLVLDLVRPQVEAGSCAGCGAALGGCRLEFEGAQPDRIQVAATCRACGARTQLQLRPLADGGTASIH